MIPGLLYRIVNYYEPDIISDGESKKIHCIFKSSHNNEDNNMSAKIYGQNEIYKCWGCGFYGDAVSVVMNMEECSYKEARVFIKENFGVDIYSESKHADPKVIERLSKYIVDNIIELKPKNFLALYKILDEYIENKDEIKLTELLERIVSEKSRRKTQNT